MVMVRARRARAVVFVSGIALCASAAHAAGPASETTSTADWDEPFRFQLSGGFGIGGDSDGLSIDGGPDVHQSGSSSDFTKRYELGFALKVNSVMRLSAMLLGGDWSDDWSASAGERRERIDLRLSPEVSLLNRFKISLGLGPTLAGIEPAQHRAVKESYGTGVGFNAGGRMTVMFRLGRSLGGYLAVDQSFFWIWMRHRATVDGNPSLAVDERFKFSGRSTCFSAGLTYSW